MTAYGGPSDKEADIIGQHALEASMTTMGRNEKKEKEGREENKTKLKTNNVIREEEK